MEPELLLPTCTALAQTIDGLDAGVVAEYKSTLNDGLHMALGPALDMERRRARSQYGSLGQTQIGDRAGSFLSKL